MKVTRETIVLAARELFREKGYAGASMQDLANCIGLKKSSIYARFPSKEALVLDVLALTLQETLAQCDDKDLPWDLAYEAIVKSIAENLIEQKRCVGLHLAYGVGNETPIAKEAVKDFFKNIRDRMSDILTQVMPRETADHVASDALIRLEGATLFIALFNESGIMQRATLEIMQDARIAAKAAY